MDIFTFNCRSYVRWAGSTLIASDGDIQHWLISHASHHAHMQILSTSGQLLPSLEHIYIYISNWHESLVDVENEARRSGQGNSYAPENEARGLQSSFGGT